MTPDAVQVADQFHVIKLANTKLDEVRRRVQNQTLGHRGHRDDPLYRARKLLVMAEARVIDAGGRERLLGLLDAGDPKGEVRTAWSAKELVRDLYSHRDPDVALETVVQLAQDLGGLGGIAAAVELFAEIVRFVADNRQATGIASRKTAMGCWVGTERLVAADIAKAA